MGRSVRTVSGMTTSDYVPVPVRLDFDALVPGFSRAVSALDDAATAELDRAGIDNGLRELVRLRAAQLNGCAYCVDCTARAACKSGVAPQRVDAVAIWPESNLFTEQDRAALDFAEQVTLLGQHPGAGRKRPRRRVRVRQGGSRRAPLADRGDQHLEHHRSRWALLAHRRAPPRLTPVPGREELLEASRVRPRREATWALAIGTKVRYC